MAFAEFHRWQASSLLICKRHPALCRSELASRWHSLDFIAGKPAPTGSASDALHSAGASLSRDGIRWISSLASQLPQELQATPRTLQERACLAMASAESHRWQASSHRICKRRPALCRSELVSRWHSLNPIAGKPAPSASASERRPVTGLVYGSILLQYAAAGRHHLYAQARCGQVQSGFVQMAFE